MLRVDAETQNIALRQAHVLEELPYRIWRARRSDAAIFGREARKRRLPIGMGIVPAEGFFQMLAERFVVHGNRGLDERAGTESLKKREFLSGLE